MNEAKKIKINFKMPPESAADRMHRLHQQIRKKSGLPDPEEYKKRAAEKQREIDAMKEAAPIPVGQHDQSISNKAKSQKSSAETRARAMGAAAATRSKNAALRDVVKEPERDVREAAMTHYVKVNNALKTTPSGAHVMKFPDKESAQRHAAEHKRRNPNHHVTVTTNATDSTPVWHGGTKLRPYAMREGIDMQQQEAKDTREYDYEGDMAKSQLRAIIANAQQVHDMLEDNTNMAEWVQSKITLAADYISTVADYMQAEVKEETDLEEAIKLGSKVMIHAPGKSYHGKTGQVGEIRKGAFKGAPKTYTVDHDSGSIQLSQKNVKLHKEEVEQVDEISANLAGNYLDKVKAKHGNDYNTLSKKRQRGVVNALDIKMNAAEKKIKEEADLKEAGGMKSSALVKAMMRKQKQTAAMSPEKQAQQKKEYHDKKQQNESIDDHIEQTLAAKDINSKVEGDKVHVHPDNLSKARYTLDKMGVKHSVHGTLKDSVEYCHWEIVTEGWSQGNRNPQRGIKIGDKVRSYDFPGMHDDHYVEGHVVRDTPSSYHLRVNKVVRSGKEIPVPAHMAHVEAPKGKGLFSDAYGVHKIMAKQQSVSATQEPVMGAQKTFTKVRGR